jgi:glutathione S-transferase
VLARNERERAQPSDEYLASVEIRKAAVLKCLEQEAGALATATFGIGHIAIGCALCYLDFRFAGEEWRKDHPRIASWHYAFASRPSVRATEPVDDS